MLAEKSTHVYARFVRQIADRNEPDMFNGESSLFTKHEEGLYLTSRFHSYFLAPLLTSDIPQIRDILWVARAPPLVQSCACRTMSLCASMYHRNSTDASQIASAIGSSWNRPAGSTYVYIVRNVMTLSRLTV